MADVTIYSTKATLIRSDNPDTNFGDGNTMYSGKVGGATLRPLIEFDLSSLNGTINSAILYVNVNYAPNGGVNAYTRKITSSWNEGTVTYNTIPTFDGTTNYGTIDLTSVASKSVNITTLVSGWNEGTINNYGLILIPTTADDNKYGAMDSDDVATESNRPKLVIDYTPAFIPQIIMF